MKTDLRSTDTKERVISEARRLCQAGGYSHLNLDSIAKSLSVTRPALYFHFPGGKEELLVAVIKSFGTEINRRFEEAIKAGHNTHSRAKNILLSLAQQPLLQQHELVQAGQDHLTDEAQLELQQIFYSVNQKITDMIQDGIGSGELRAVDPNIAFFSFMGLCKQVEQYLTLCQIVPRDFACKIPTNIEEMIDKLLELWFGGMDAPTKV